MIETMNKKPECPSQDTLRNYLLGNLEPDGLDQFECDFSACEQCHETLRGMSAEDTFSSHVANAFQDRSTPDFQTDEEEIVRRLIDRMTDTSVLLRDDKPDGTDSVAAVSQRIDIELMADRAAEVLRCLASEDARLGRLGHYELIRLIGAGSSGVVFLANDLTLDRTVAIKVLRPSLGPLARERFLAEAKAAARVDHPNVIAIYHVGQEDRLAYIVMKWTPGQTLEAQLETEGVFEEERVVQLVQEIALGLIAAQKQQLIHRDIKPANIWVSDDGSIQLLDFGLARVADDDSGLTATGMLAGTPNYMSPEQAKGLELDGRSDLFSLGCVMYKLLTGRLPFGGATVLGTLQAIQHEQPQPPQSLNSEVSGKLNDLTMALLEKQPANRPASAEELICLLESDRQDWPSTISRYATAPTKPDSSNQYGGRRKGWSLASIGWSLLIATLFLGSIGYFFGPQIIRIATDQGELVIETNEGEEVQIEILQNGKVIRLVDVKSQSALDIRSGKYQIRAGNKADADSVAFSVSPQELTMTRGGKNLVKVTRIDDAAPNLSTNDLSPLVANTADGNDLVDFSADSGTPTLPRQVRADEDSPTYNGFGFDHWLRIARKDRHPETFSEALAACAELADSDSLRKEIVELIREKVRQHNLSVTGANPVTDRMLDSFIRAFRSFPKKYAAEFALEESIHGNGNSQGFITWLQPSRMLSNGELPILANDQQTELRNEFLSRLSKWLVAASNAKGARQRQLMYVIVDFTHGIESSQMNRLDPSAKTTVLEHQDKLKPIKSVQGDRLAYPLLNRLGVRQLDYVKQIGDSIEVKPILNYKPPQWAPIANYWLLPWPAIDSTEDNDHRLLHQEEIDLRLRILSDYALAIAESEFWTKKQKQKQNRKTQTGSELQVLFTSIYQHLHFCSESEREKTVAKLDKLYSSSAFFRGDNTFSKFDESEIQPQIDARIVLKSLLDSISTGNPEAYSLSESSAYGYARSFGVGGFGGGGFGGGGFGNVPYGGAGGGGLF